ncbi:LysR family transcriptional regulator [Halomonas sp. M4R1S46]|uniref:LysR family transcriptional regulator n=1 Tax=Halomonas sp. M4R1S46 TaxID=2982692 RepID=UPI002964F08B|nr:LysR family transcriptional regulator [Halomonas sp. M4R1S46]
MSPSPRLPLTTLRAFEAAARRGSFSAAAEELHVTAASVSPRIETLAPLRRAMDTAPPVGTTLYRHHRQAPGRPARRCKGNGVGGRRRLSPPQARPEPPRAP